jgi:hypothetical protein
MCLWLCGAGAFPPPVFQSWSSLLEPFPGQVFLGGKLPGAGLHMRAADIAPREPLLDLIVSSNAELTVIPNNFFR